MNAHRQLVHAKSQHDQSMGRLASGNRVMSSRDDAAGIGTSSAMQAQVRGLAAGIRNGQEMRNVLSIAEASMGEVGDILQRMRELALEAASESTTEPELKAMELEYIAIRDSIDRVSHRAKYNGERVMDGNFVNKRINVGGNSGADNRVRIDIDRIDSLFIGVSFTHLENEMFARAALVQIDKAIDKVNDGRANMSAQMHNLDSATRHSQIMKESMAATRSNVQDADVAAETSTMSRAQIRLQAGASMLSQANVMTMAALKLMQ